MHDFWQRIMATLVIVAMLGIMGIPLPIIVFFAIVVYLIWRMVQRTEINDVGRVFEFYVAATEVLRDEERRWFGFEIEEIINRGERILLEIGTVAPPLMHFTLGALYRKTGAHAATVEHLSIISGAEATHNEMHILKPTPALRRYTNVLRKIEQEPNDAPKTVAALRWLERSRRAHADEMLSDARVALGLDTAAGQMQLFHHAHAPARDPHAANGDRQSLYICGNPLLQEIYAPEKITERAPQSPPDWRNAPNPATPAPISEVLRDLYEDEQEKKTA